MRRNGKSRDPKCYIRERDGVYETDEEYQTGLEA
jgi:hypothetical protein